MENEDGCNFFQMMITGDESSNYEYDPETKRQNKEWKHSDSPRTKKQARVVQKSRWCSLFSFDIRGVVHHEFVPHGQTVNAAFIVEDLKRLLKRV
jgi:hypothetical protein